MKKVFLWIGIVLLTPILLFVILTVLLYIPPVQNWAVQKTVAYASEKTGMDISVDKIRLEFPLDLSVEGFKVISRNDSLPQVRDTVADVSKLVVDIQLRPLFKQQVVINTLELNKTKVNTSNLIASAHVEGSLGRLAVSGRSVDLGLETVDLGDVELSDANVHVALNDTVPPDTTTSETLWKINIDRIGISHTTVSVLMPGDTLQIQAYMKDMAMSRGTFDLGNGTYDIGNIVWDNGSLTYDNLNADRSEGLDPSHIALNDINIGIDSIYYSPMAAHLNISHCHLKERCGMELTKLKGQLSLDSMRVTVPSMVLRTPYSDVELTATADLNVTDSINPGTMDVRLSASLGKQDVMKFFGDMPRGFVNGYPTRPLEVSGRVSGNLHHADIRNLHIDLPTAFMITADGYADNPTDMKKMRADMKMKARTWNVGFLTALLDPATAAGFRIPSGMSIDGNIQADHERYAVDLALREGIGTIRAKGSFNAANTAYQAVVGIDRINLNHFIPNDSLHIITAHMDMKGAGTDVLSKRFRMQAEASVDTFVYGSWVLDKMNVRARIADGMAHGHLESRNALMDGTIDVDALLDPNRIQATIGTDMNKADLYRLRIMEKPFIAGMCAHVDIASDMKQYHMIRGYFNDFTIQTEKKTYRPADLTVDATTTRDTTWAKMSSGSMNLYMTAGCGYEELIKQGNVLSDELSTQMHDKVIDHPRLREKLPDIKLRLVSGPDNPMANFLRFKGFSFKDLFVDFSASPQNGVNADMHLYSIIADSMRIDTVRLRIYQDMDDVRLTGMVQNNKRNPQFVFRTLFDGVIHEKSTEMNVRYYDAANKLGVLLGARAEMLDSGIHVKLLPEKPVLGYKVFNLNNDNYIMLGRNRRIMADIDLVADDKTGVKIYSEDQDTDMLQDLTVSLNQFDLEKITSVLPYAPRISGLLNGDLHVHLDKNEKIAMVSDMTVRKMAYENCPIGDLNSEFAYLQQEDSAHFVEATLNCDGREIGVLSGTYKDENGGLLDATFNMTRFPLSMVNGFIPDRIFGFTGYAEGKVDVKGALDKPVVDGEVLLDSSYIVSVPYGMNLRFDNDPVRVVKSNLLFENFTMYAHNSNPLNIAGNIDFSNLDNIRLNLKMMARDYQIIDARQERNSVAYGKAFVNFYGSLAGSFDDLVMRGKLDVLGKTNMTYILKDSPLNTDDHLKEIVTFTDFRDTTLVEKADKPAIGGLDMQLMMDIESGAHIKCALNADQSNYVDIEGGGELRMVYNSTDDLQLFGRYTIVDGKMKYSLPIIPLKTFNIGEGSYIEFTGDMMNPRLNLTATEKVKTMVTTESGENRSVMFDCGVKVTKTLNDMGLEFTINAPEDMSMSNELAAMSAEERGKIAVMMLTTGMYITDNSTGNFSMNGALSSFLNSQINNITGSAMRTMDLSLGFDQNSDATGNTYTDYSFKFAKRFWNNRVNFVIGGKLSDGGNAAVAEQDQTFIDNVSLEYRLDQTAMRYVRLFYNKEAYDLLEGNISEYGAGFVWRKKADRLWRLFNFRSSDTGPNTLNRLQGSSGMASGGISGNALRKEKSNKKTNSTDSINANENSK